MIHTVDAIDDQGVFRLVEPLSLPPGTRVHLRVEDANGAGTAATEREIPTLLERMKGFVGVVDDLPSDASVNLDHYLYGLPKRQ
jgi:hypothetical protein